MLVVWKTHWPIYFPYRLTSTHPFYAGPVPPFRRSADSPDLFPTFTLRFILCTSSFAHTDQLWTYNYNVYVCMIRYDMLGIDMIWYMIYDIWYMIWYDICIYIYEYLIYVIYTLSLIWYTILHNYISTWYSMIYPKDFFIYNFFPKLYGLRVMYGL